MKTRLLWIAAVLALAGPCIYLANGHSHAMSAAAKRGLAGLMHRQAMVFEVEQMYRLPSAKWPPDPQAVKDLIQWLNAEIKKEEGPQARAEIRKEGINPDALPKAVPWVLAPERAKRTLSLEIRDDQIVILGWGFDLDKPIYEKIIRMRSAP